jgi:hypothetical protein
MQLRSRALSATAVTGAIVLSGVGVAWACTGGDPGRHGSGPTGATGATGPTAGSGAKASVRRHARRHARLHHRNRS